MIKSTVTIALEWAIRSFGAEHVMNKPVRSLRVAEEAVELAQAYGVPKEKLHDLVDIVYSRPNGDPDQEIGGVLMTVNVLCGAQGRDPDAMFETELRRVLAKPTAHFEQRNKDKVDMGLTV